MSFSSTSHCSQSYLAGGVCVAVAGGVVGFATGCGCAVLFCDSQVLYAFVALA
jgi:hypothetical protein